MTTNQEKRLYALEKARSAPRKSTSWRKCVDKACKDCIYDPDGGHGTWRQQVQNCSDLDCGLYQIRPTSSGDSSSVLPVSERQRLDAVRDAKLRRQEA